MALKNIPSAIECGCDELKVNMSLAAGIGADAGDANTYGAFQAAFDVSNSVLRSALDPRDCSNKIFLDASGVPKVTLEYHLPDCTPIDDACEDGFSCDPAPQTATPTVQTQDFAIDQCSFFKLTLTPDDWAQTCCGLEEYYKQIAESRADGNLIHNTLRGIVQSALNDGSWDMYSYSARLLAERIQRTMNDPINGKLAQINEYVLNKLDAGAGYNYTTDNTGAVVGTGTWTLPVLVPRFINGCATGEKVIDANGLRRILERFIAQHPNCGSDFIVLGGDYFRELIGELGILSCCTPDGVNQDAALRRALGLLSNLIYDSQIDALFGKGTFFIIERGSFQFFWLNLWNDARYNQANKAYIKMGGQYKWLMKQQGKNDFGVTNFSIANCNTGGYGLGYDTFFNSPENTACENPTYNFHFMSQYGMWTRPQFDCGNYKGRTGIYKGLLVDAC